MPPFLFLSFLLFILAYLPLPAQGVYIFYNSWFRFLGETSIPHTFSWKESTCIKKTRFALATTAAFGQTESLVLVVFFTRTFDLITVTHRKPCPPCPTVSPGHDKCDKIKWYTNIEIFYSLHCTTRYFYPRAVHFHMIRRNSNAVTINMGRGAYDTTGTLKPGQPPPPKPR